MYLRYFNFSTKPFAMNPDPAFLFPSEQHARALTMLEYAIESQAAFCVLTGEIGSGKTTLVRHLIRTLGSNLSVGLISNTHEHFRSIHPWVLSAFGIVARDSSEIAQYEALTEFFIREYGKGRRTLLIFDEAQNLSIQTLEELRLLSNLNSEEDVALQTLLVGQPELRLKIAQPELKQFSQRVAVDFHLRSLSSSETEAYIRHRLTTAGGSDTIFQAAAIAYIHRLAGGIPRLVNRLCDLSLVYAFADRCERIDVALVAQVLQDANNGMMSQRVSNDALDKVAPIDPVAPPSKDGLLRERA
jgi:type II secretory pathway predicted ATPase ExeA